MAEEKNMNPESFDQDSVMIYIDPKVLNSLNDMAEKKQEDLKALQAAAEDGDLDAQYRLGRSYYYGPKGRGKGVPLVFQSCRGRQHCRPVLPGGVLCPGHRHGEGYGQGGGAVCRRGGRGLSPRRHRAGAVL